MEGRAEKEVKGYAGYRKWINVNSIHSLKYYVNQKIITNLEYLEGLILLAEINENDSKSSAACIKAK